MAQGPLGYEASRITRMRDGKVCAINCLLNYSKPIPVDEAIDRVKNKKIAFVNREDATLVLAGVAE